MKIPYGIHDYKTIKSEEYLFVDKTEFIKTIEDIGTYLVFLRPRRFGKSLFTSMLNYYYDINYQKEFDILFKDTYIGTNKTTKANNYYILKFDFSGINTEKDLVRTAFFRTVKLSIDACIDYYNLDIDIELDVRDANEYLENFLQKLKTKTNRQIYLIIDEYDHFANSILASDLTLFNDITGKDGFVRTFYEVFKTYAGSVIGRMFITGVTPITLDSLTSGFNMAINVSKDQMLNEMMGFTENEVIDILNKLNINKNHIKILKEYYNGYLFSEESTERLYNSNLILYYVRSYVLYGRQPKNYTDPNIISDYSKITGMFNLYKFEEDKKSIIHNILNENVISTTLIDKFIMKSGFEKDEFLSLMYYLGLLSIDTSYGNDIYLKTPNYIIKNVYFEYYYRYLNEMLETNIDVRHIKDSIIELSKNNNIKPFIQLIEGFLTEILNRNFIKFDEKYIKLLIVTYMRLSDMYLVKTEYEVNGRYIDIALLPNNVFELNNYFIIEVKYISDKNYTDRQLDKEKNNATVQIIDYGSSEEMKQIKNLRKYVLVFVYDKCKIIEEINS